MARRRDVPEEQAQAQTVAENIVAEAEKAEAERKRQDEERKRKAISDYERELSYVLDLQGMTDTDAWKAIFRETKKVRANHQEALVTCPAKEVASHQEACKFIDLFVEMVAKPVKDLADLTADMPLFRTEFHTTAEFSKELGTVTTRRS